MADSLEVPRALLDRARAFVASGAEPAPTRSAATVVLLRERPGRPFEVYLIRRVAAMAFGGNYAFPGGGVDPSDAGVRLDWVGPTAAEWAPRLGVPADRAQAIVCAAGREVFEEVGVLLAGPTPDTVVGDVSGAEWETARTALERREVGFAELLSGRGLALRGDLLASWGRWVTPEFEPRRFDTHFFVAALPEGQRTRDVSTEADHVEWVAPAEVLARADAGEIRLLPPTRVTLAEIAACADISAVFAAAAGRDSGAPVKPRIETAPDGELRLITD
jgi:8-oxo-dGTP pyrophosphatase MutT (NUDIX family)